MIHRCAAAAGLLHAETEEQQVVVRGNSIAAQLAVNTTSQAVAEVEAFANLKLLRRLLRAEHA